MNNDLLKIKKYYGEDMMHLCRRLFPTIIEKEELFNILISNIAPSRSVYEDIVNNNLEENFKNFIFCFVEMKDNYLDTEENPFDLMRKAGYTLYECKSNNDIKKFEKYYRQDELICTFRSANRLSLKHVFFAVHDNATKLDRSDFLYPMRDDPYGTSVISIQFDKGEFNTLSIKNRYNHKVIDPDCTFGNNLERIIPGLTKSFEKYYHFNINKPVIIDNFFTNYLKYTKASNGKIYRYNCKRNSISYCENNVIIENGKLVGTYANNKERYLVMDYFILDLKEKSIYTYNNDIEDGFVDSIYSVGKIDKIDVKNNDSGKIITIIYEDKKEVYIYLNKQNSIIGYINNYVKKIDNYFLCFVNNVKKVELNEVTEIKNMFLCNNGKLKVSLPRVEKIENNFLQKSNIISISLPNLVKVGDYFMSNNYDLREIFVPNLEYIGYCFLTENRELEELTLLKVKEIDDCFLYHNKKLKKLNISSDVIIGEDALRNNELINNLENGYGR